MAKKGQSQHERREEQNVLLQPASTHMESSVSVRSARRQGVSQRWERMMKQEEHHGVLIEGLYSGVSGRWARPGASGKWQRDGISGVWKRPGQSTRSARNDILDKWQEAGVIGEWRHDAASGRWERPQGFKSVKLQRIPKGKSIK